MVGDSDTTVVSKDLEVVKEELNSSSDTECHIEQIYLKQEVEDINLALDATSHSCNAISKVEIDIDETPVDNIKVFNEETIQDCKICGSNFEPHVEEEPQLYLVRNYNSIDTRRTHSIHKPFKCTTCSYAALHHGALATHMRTHAAVKQHSCIYCNFITTEVETLLVHIETHDKEKPYKCLQCAESFTYAVALKRHMQTHKEVKIYTCEICMYKVKSASALESHKRSHSGEKPYKCDQCGYCSLAKFCLDRHMRTHTGNKPYKCGICGFSTAYRRGLSRHERRWH